MKEEYTIKAFISCSLDAKDQRFNQLVESIVKKFRFQPFGTVGIHDATAEHPSELMKKNIKESDVVVISGTKRFLTKDVRNQNEKFSFSDMIKVESGIAYALGKPIIAFIENDVHAGDFLFSRTQCIFLEGSQEDLDNKYHLIKALFDNTRKEINDKRDAVIRNDFGRAVIAGLAIYGGIKALGLD